jgi:two-component system CheB/CheR fusion protein
VLVVDDDTDTREMFEMLLSSLGWSVVVAASGDEAIERFDPAATDFILTDVGMPDMDGCMLLNRLRDGAAADTPAVAITGYGGQEIEARLRESGFDGYLTKPFHLASLLDLLREIGEQRSK